MTTSVKPVEYGVSSQAFRFGPWLRILGWRADKSQMTYPATVGPAVDPAMKYGHACAAVVDYLKVHVPLGAWAVTRLDAGRDTQIFLTLNDEEYGLAPGATLPWSGSLCRRMFEEGAPNIAPDAMAVPAYRDAPNASALPIGTWVSFPIRRADGSLFGTLCGADPARHSEALDQHEPLLILLSQLLESILNADLTCTAFERAMERVQGEAETDGLTGLLNRRGWDARLDAEERRRARFGDSAAVIVIDLDGLKRLNDSCGHAAGDEFLKRAAGCLTEVIGEQGVIARVGGDEFVILVEPSPDDAVALLGRLRDELRARGLPASLGCALYSRTDGLLDAWAAADIEMYANKRQRYRAPLAAFDHFPRQRA